MRCSNLKEFKENQGLTNKQLADMFHVTPEYISYLLNEKRFPSRELAKKIGLKDYKVCKCANDQDTFVDAIDELLNNILN